MHDGTTSFLKLLTVLIFVCVAVWWLTNAIGENYTVLAIGALALVVVFAAGALFAHMNQKQTLDAITKFNTNDAQIDKYRMASFKAMAQGESAMQKAAAQLQVIDAKRVTKLADQQAKLLIDSTRQPDQSNSWDVFDNEDMDDAESFVQWE